MEALFFVIILALIVHIVFKKLQSKSIKTTSELLRHGEFDLPIHKTYALDIVGEASYQENIAKIAGQKTKDGVEHHTKACLILENTNPYDDQAVRVDIEGLTVGYLSRKDARSYREQLQINGHPLSTFSCDAKIVGGWKRSEYNQGHYGVKLNLRKK